MGYLDKIAQLDTWSREAVIKESVRTVFLQPIPDELAFLSGGFVDMGFARLGLTERQQWEICLCMCLDVGVRVPGTPYRMIRTHGMFTAIELAQGLEKADLPANWKQSVLVRREGWSWIGKLWLDWAAEFIDMSQFDDAGDGFIPKIGMTNPFYDPRKSREPARRKTGAKKELLLQRIALRR